MLKTTKHDKLCSSSIWIHKNKSVHRLLNYTWGIPRVARLVVFFKIRYYSSDICTQTLAPSRVTFIWVINDNFVICRIHLALIIFVQPIEIWLLLKKLVLTGSNQAQSASVSLILSVWRIQWIFFRCMLDTRNDFHKMSQFWQHSHDDIQMGITDWKIKFLTPELLCLIQHSVVSYFLKYDSGLKNKTRCSNSSSEGFPEHSCNEHKGIHHASCCFYNVTRTDSLCWE